MKRYGSDVVVEGLQGLGLPFISLNPGASFRGVHDSLVHHGAPEMILTLSENVTVAVAHGYGKATGRPMGAIVHNVVGLQNASMAIFNAWIDQAPVVILGGSGPADHARRRPWIDWIHTAKPQGAVIRDVVKWDDEPRSVEGIPDSLARAYAIASTPPQGPTYVALDSLLQEAEVAPDLDARISPPRCGRLTAPPDELAELADKLLAAEHPVLLADLAGRGEAAFTALQRLATALAAPVVDLGGRHNFPSSHWADGTLDRDRFLRRADVVLAVDVRDLRWATSVSDMAAHSYQPLVSPDAVLLSMGLNDLLHTGMFDREPLVDRAVSAVADSNVALPALADLVERAAGDRRERRRALTRETDELRATAARETEDQAGRMTEVTLAAAVWDAVRDGPWLLASGALRGAARRTWQFEDFGCFLGGSGGEGLGYGLGASIGAALAHRDRDTLVVNMQTDGDFLYSASALWTAAQQRLPLLTVVVNNRSYGRDRTHQSVVGRLRGRPVENAAVGIDIEDPAVDFGLIAEAQRVESFGRVMSPGELGPTLRRAAARVRAESLPALVEIVIERRD
ncbi:MAG: thiamine pyrophosphate-binding protein [Nitriliruptorales bacterium]|nr:thiamine pyrophosphate-binding protein [Nitriliruptorales bacterium]